MAPFATSPPRRRVESIANSCLLQAASGIESLKMGDSPAKKLDFGVANKENEPLKGDAPVFDDIEIKKPIVEEVKKEITTMIAPTLKPEEADEPLLRENPQRFVLFPIKYHEVSRVDALSVLDMADILPQ